MSPRCRGAVRSVLYTSVYICAIGVAMLSAKVDAFGLRVAGVGPFLVNKGGSGCTSSKKCTQCQGDCDGDGVCAAGLKCFQRDASSQQVSGCSTCGAGDVGTRDYCSIDGAGSKHHEVAGYALDRATVCGQQWWNTGSLGWGKRAWKFAGDHIDAPNAYVKVGDRYSDNRANPAAYRNPPAPMKGAAYDVTNFAMAKETCDKLGCVTFGTVTCVPTGVWRGGEGLTHQGVSCMRRSKCNGVYLTHCNQKHQDNIIMLCNPHLGLKTTGTLRRGGGNSTGRATRKPTEIDIGPVGGRRRCGQQQGLI